MGGCRALATLASIALALPLTPSPIAAEIPCPVAELDPAPQRPPQPTPPRHEPGERTIGGTAMATAGLVVPADAPDPPTDLSATTWLVADLDSGAVLGGCGPHEYGIPASTQKLLLAAALLDELEPDQVVEVTREDLDIEPGSSAVGLVPGGEYPVETLWLGLLLSSGNEAANALARVGGGEAGLEGGLRAMNQEARWLGAYQTHAATASGLDGPGQFTSAYDLALIARQLFDRDDFARYIATERTNIPAQPQVGAAGFQIQNDNQLLLQYAGALGGKTGFTDLARSSFVGAAQRDGRRLVVTLLGAEHRPVPAWQQAAALLDWGFALPPDATVGRLVEPGELAEQATSSTYAPAAPSPTRTGTAPAAAPAGMPATLALGWAGAVAVVALLILVVTRRRRAGR